MDVTRTGERLRAAIGAGDWALAQGVLLEYRGDVEKAWTAAAEEDQRSALKQQVCEMMEWARKAAIGARSRDRQNLLRLVRGGAYAEVHPHTDIFRIDV